MRKTLLVSMLLVLFAFVAFVPVSTAEMVKEGTGSGTTIYSTTMTVVPLDKDRQAMIYEAIGANISDTGEGPFHNMSTRNIGVICYDKGVGKLRGYMVMTAPDGDKVLCELNEDKTLPPPNPNTGTGKFIGGTGKYTGIEGTVEYTRYYARPAKEGTSQGISHSKATWKIP